MQGSGLLKSEGVVSKGRFAEARKVCRALAKPYQIDVLSSSNSTPNQPSVPLITFNIMCACVQYNDAALESILKAPNHSLKVKHLRLC